MSDTPMPEAVITIDGYTFTRLAGGGYGDGDLTYTTAQIAAALLTGEAVPA